MILIASSDAERRIGNPHFDVAALEVLERSYTREPTKGGAQAELFQRTNSLLSPDRIGSIIV